MLAIIWKKNDRKRVQYLENMRRRCYMAEEAIHTFALSLKKLFSVFQIKMFFPTLRSFDPSFRSSPLHHVLRSLAVSLCLSTVFPISWLVCLPCHSVSFPNSSFLTCESWCSKVIAYAEARVRWNRTTVLQRVSRVLWAQPPGPSSRTRGPVVSGHAWLAGTHQFWELSLG